MPNGRSPRRTLPKARAIDTVRQGRRVGSTPRQMLPQWNAMARPHGMRVLVIGGSMFLGRAMVSEALRRGDDVTVFNRGRSRPDRPGVQAVHGDREVPEDLR